MKNHSKHFLITLVLFTLAFFSPTKAKAITCADLNGAYLYSQEDTPVYLGFFGNRFASESIYSRFGDYGSQHSSQSVRNTFGTYGSRFGTYSHMNRFTQNPPVILKDGVILGYLTVNQSIFGGITLATIDAASCNFTATIPDLPYNPPPPAPANLEATDGASYTEVYLDWTLSAGATGYNIYIATTATEPPSFLGSTVAPIVAATGLQPYINYYFWVSSYNAYGESSLVGPTEGSTFVEPVKIEGGEQYISIEDAYTDAGNGAVIMTRVDAFSSNLAFNFNKTITLDGGYNLNFTDNKNHMTTVSSSLTISNGTVTVENIIIQ